MFKKAPEVLEAALYSEQDEGSDFEDEMCPRRRRKSTSALKQNFYFWKQKKQNLKSKTAELRAEKKQILGRLNDRV